MSFCDKCGDLAWPEPHVCFPHRVWCPSDGASEAAARTIWARTLRRAVEKWAEAEDACGPTIALGEASPLVRACRLGETPRALRVTGRYEAVYDCEEVEDE